MSVAANIMNMNAQLNKLHGRLATLEAAGLGDRAAAAGAVEAFVGKELAARADSEMGCQLERRVNEKFDARLDAALGAKLDALLDGKLDVKVGVGIRRERAFLEAALKESVTKAMVDVVDARVRALRAECDARFQAMLDERLRARCACAAGACAPGAAAEAAAEAAPDAAATDDAVVLGAAAPAGAARPPRKAKRAT